MKSIKNLVTVMLLLSTVTALPMKRQLEGKQDVLESKRQKTTQYVPQTYVCTDEKKLAKLVKLQSAEGDIFVVDLETAQRSCTLKDAIEVFGLSEKLVIPLATVSSEILKVIIRCLQDPHQALFYLASLKIEDLYSFINACNFLAIETGQNSVNLLKLGIQAYAASCMHAHQRHSALAQLFSPEIDCEVAKIITQQSGILPWLMKKLSVHQMAIAAENDDQAHIMCFSDDVTKLAVASPRNVVTVFNTFDLTTVATINAGWNDNAYIIFFKSDAQAVAIASQTCNTKRLGLYTDNHVYGIDDWGDSEWFGQASKIMRMSEKEVNETRILFPSSQDIATHLKMLNRLTLQQALFLLTMKGIEESKPGEVFTDAAVVRDLFGSLPAELQVVLQEPSVGFVQEYCVVQ